MSIIRFKLKSVIRFYFTFMIVTLNVMVCFHNVSIPEIVWWQIETDNNSKKCCYTETPTPLLLFSIFNILDWSLSESVCISEINIRVDSFYLFQSQIWSKGNNRVSWPGCTGRRRHFLRARCRAGTL